VLRRYTSGQLQQLYSHDVSGRVEIQDHPGFDLFGFNDRGVVEAEVQRVAVRVDLEPHSLPFIRRSKNTVTIRSGIFPGFTTLRKTRPACSWITLR
jgi:hypothetical protein